MTTVSGESGDVEESTDPLDVRLARLEAALKLNEKLINTVTKRRDHLIAAADEAEFEECLEDFGGDLATDDDGEGDEDDQIRPLEVVTPSTSNKKQAKPVSLLPFFKPYFRDSSGISAPRLYDPTSLDPSLVALLQTPRLNRPWKAAEVSLLLKSVRSQYLPHYNAGLIRQMETLLEEAPEVKPKQLINEINALNSELALAESKGIEPPLWSPVIDWLAIAKALPPDRSGDDAELAYNNAHHTSIPKGPASWTIEADNKLVQLVDEHGNDWDTIAALLGTGHLSWQCCARYQAELNTNLRKSGKIEGTEAEQLLEIINQYKLSNGKVNWANVACLIEGRSIGQVTHWYNKLLNPTVVRKWTTLEDKMLIAGNRLFGNQWHKIAQYIPLRNNRQIRERFKNQLEFKQNRKFGHWTEPEDELILEMSTKYVKVVAGVEQINFPEIQRLYFPNRNVYQVYRRYTYLRRLLPPTALPEPTSEAATTETTVDGAELLSTVKVTRNRSRSRGSGVSLPLPLPSEPEKLMAILVEGRKRLLKAAEKVTVEIRQDEETGGPVSVMTIEKPPPVPRKRGRRGEVQRIRRLPPNGPLTEEEAEQHWEADQLLQALFQLADLRYTPKGGFLSKLDLNVNDVLSTVLLELVDPSVKQNLQLTLLPPDEVQTEDEAPNEDELQPDEPSVQSEELQPIEDGALVPVKPGIGVEEGQRRPSGVSHLPDFSICPLDTLRFFLTLPQLGIGHPRPSPSEPKCLLPPNLPTMFGYAILGVMSKSLLIQLSEADPESVVEPLEESISTSDQFADLRSIFTALFVWPALLSQEAIAGDERIKKVLLKKAGTQEDVEEEEKVPIAPVKKLGRPKKRKFYFTKVDIDFTSIRAYQQNIFLTLIRSQTLELLQAVYPFTQSTAWTDEPPGELLERVHLFLDIICHQVDATIGTGVGSIRKKAKKEHLARRDAAADVRRKARKAELKSLGVKRASELTESPTVDEASLRRSGRARKTVKLEIE